MFGWFKKKKQKEGAESLLSPEAEKRVRARQKELDKIFSAPSQPSPNATDGQTTEIPEEVQITIREKFFSLANGQRVSLERIFIAYTYYLSFGDPIIGREYTLALIPEDVKRIFRAQAVCILEPPPGPLPRFTFYAHLESGPIDAANDHSYLIVVWFDDLLPTDLKSFIATSTARVEWKKYAKDTEY